MRLGGRAVVVMKGASVVTLFRRAPALYCRRYHAVDRLTAAARIHSHPRGGGVPSVIV